jgi:hypothetical protein
MRVVTNELPKSAGYYVSVFSRWRRDGTPVVFTTKRAILPESHLTHHCLVGVHVSVPEYLVYLKTNGVRIPERLTEGPNGSWRRRLRPDFDEMDGSGTGNLLITRWEYGPDDVGAYCRMEYKSGVMQHLTLGRYYMSEQGVDVDRDGNWEPVD